MAMSSLNLYTNGSTNRTDTLSASGYFPLGYLVYKSRFLPRILGILLIADFFGLLICVLQRFLLPDYDVISYPYSDAISFIAEISLTVWLLIMGVKEQK